MDYTKLEWHDGAPKELRVGMILEYGDKNQHVLIGHLNSAGANCFSCPHTRIAIVFPGWPYDKINKWAWLPGFEEE